MTDSLKSLENEVQDLFEDQIISDELSLKYLETLERNLILTEKKINRGFLEIVLSFIGFLFLDIGIVEKVTILGTEFGQTGMLLLIFPLAIAFLKYQLNLRIVFAHDLRTTVALIYKNMAPKIYIHGFDLLTHYPSIRNIESYYGKLVEGGGRKLLDFSTTVVTIVLSFVPHLAVIFCFYRTYNIPNIPLWPWLVAILIASVFLLRSIIIDFFIPAGRTLEYSKRSNTTLAEESGSQGD